MNFYPFVYFLLFTMRFCSECWPAGDYEAIFLFDQPDLIPRHNLYEFVWFLRTGYSRQEASLKFYILELYLCISLVPVSWILQVRA